MSGQWFVLEVNPYPWKVPPFSPGRKGNALFVKAGRDEGLHTYKQAIRELIQAGSYFQIPGEVQLYFWFWRRIETYVSPGGRRTKKHIADVTNLQKSTEDALQDLIIENDSNVRLVRSELVEQGDDTSGLVVVYAAPADSARPTGMPDDIFMRVMKIQSRATVEPSSNFYDPTRRS